jgi:molybdopterin converting factor small subunit
MLDGISLQNQHMRCKMKVTVKCFSILADGDHCRYDRSRTISMGKNEARVDQLAQQISIPEEDVSVVFVNGKHATLDSTLSEGDRVAFVPPTGGM